MEATVDDGGNDFVPVDNCATPTEAHLIKGVLESAGLMAVTTDNHLLQAYDWLTPAAGGVRVLVPASEVAAARQALEDYRAGELALPGEDAVAQRAHDRLSAPIYSPDIAALFSFLFVHPAFGAGVHLLNARTLQPGGAGALAWAWFLALATGSVGTVVLIAQGRHAALNPAVAAFGLSLLTAIWYLSFAQAHSKAVLQRFGSAYPRRSLIPLALGVFALEAALGWTVATVVG
jgi:hypothetical protein